MPPHALIMDLVVDLPGVYRVGVYVNENRNRFKRPTTRVSCKFHIAKVSRNLASSDV